MTLKDVLTITEIAEELEREDRTDEETSQLQSVMYGGLVRYADENNQLMASLSLLQQRLDQYKISADRDDKIIQEQRTANVALKQRLYLVCTAAAAAGRMAKELSEFSE